MMGLPDMSKIAEETNKVNEKVAKQTKERNELLKDISKQLKLMNLINATELRCKHPTKQKEIDELLNESSSKDEPKPL